MDETLHTNNEAEDTAEKKPSVGKFIFYLRSRHNMPIEALAAMMSLPIETVIAWERDEALPNEMQFNALSHIFATPVDFIKTGAYPIGYDPYMASPPPPYGNPYYNTANPSQRKKMSTGKLLAIIIPICVVLLFAFIFGIVAIVIGALNKVQETEQYQYAYAYLISTEEFVENEAPNTVPKLNSYNGSHSMGESRYEFGFYTDHYSYTVVVRDDGDGFYIDEEESYYSSLLEAPYETPAFSW